MDKNSIIGFVLIGLIMIGFFTYQSRQYRDQMEAQAKIDSLAMVEQIRQDSIRAAYLREHPQDTVVAARVASGEKIAVYGDSLLNAAASSEEQFYTLENEKVSIVFSTRGGQPWSVCLKDFTNYDKSPLYLFKDGKGQLGFTVYAPTAVDTRKFNFNYISCAFPSPTEGISSSATPLPRTPIRLTRAFLSSG